MSSRSLSNGSSILGRYGPGSSAGLPERDRWTILYNDSGRTMFIPEKTQAERTAVYNNFPYKHRSGPSYGVTSTKKLYANTTGHGTGPCWTPHSNNASYTTPGGCPSGYTDEGVVNGNNLNAINANFQTGVNHGDIQWMFYFDNAYGCPSGYFAKYSIRYCTKTADALGYT